MDPLQLSSPFPWSPTYIQHNNLPTPIHHDSLDDSTHHDVAGDQQMVPGNQHSHFTNPFVPEPSAMGPPHENQELFPDAVMIDSEPASHANVMDPRREEPGPASRRLKYADLDWDGNRQTLRRLYIEEDRTLTETMKIMKQDHRFDASAKLYKEKFKFWRWQKNLPGHVAHWMVDRATLREASGKRTEFEFGGQKWTLEQATKSTRRTKRDAQELVHTPAGMIVATPASDQNHTSPRDLTHQHDAGGPTSPSVIFISAEEAPSQKMLPMNFNGKSRDDLATTLLAARDYARDGEVGLAERSYVEALNGCEHLLSVTHEDTLKIAYELATFYTEQDRKADADEVLEDLTQKNIETLGIDHRNVKQHILHVAELLNSWNRGNDAMVFLNRAWDVAKYQKRNDSTLRPGTKRARSGIQKSSLIVPAKTRLQELDARISRNPSSNSIDHGLEEARLHTTVDEPAVEVLLLAIEQQCLKTPSRLATQGLRTRAELLKYYLKQDTTVEHLNVFSTAMALLEVYWRDAPWDGETIKSHEILEASLELAAAILRGNFDRDANLIFRKIAGKAGDLFGSYDERSIWICISTGIVYQTYRTWSQARQWFEQAYASADAAWGGKDGVTRSLEKTLEKQHFSYISDEGRPFKTVFGVCGMTVRPTRLHIE